MSDLKEKLIEIVRNSISEKIVAKELNKSVMRIAENMLCEEEENGKIYAILNGCQYDSYFNNLDDCLEIVEDRKDAKTVDAIIELLKCNYDTYSYEYLYDEDLVILTIEEAIKKINPDCIVSTYINFYPKNGQFKSLKSSDQAMFIIEFEK